MADIDFTIGFEIISGELRDLRRQIEQQLSNINISPQIRGAGGKRLSTNLAQSTGFRAEGSQENRQFGTQLQAEALSAFSKKVDKAAAEADKHGFALRKTVDQLLSLKDSAQRLVLEQGENAAGLAVFDTKIARASDRLDKQVRKQILLNRSADNLRKSFERLPEVIDSLNKRADEVAIGQQGRFGDVQGDRLVDRFKFDSSDSTASNAPTNVLVILCFTDAPSFFLEPREYLSIFFSVCFFNILKPFIL